MKSLSKSLGAQSLAATAEELAALALRRSGVGTTGATGVGSPGATGAQGDAGATGVGATGVGTQGATGVGTTGATGAGFTTAYGEIYAQSGLPQTGIGAFAAVNQWLGTTQISNVVFSSPTALTPSVPGVYRLLLVAYSEISLPESTPIFAFFKSGIQLPLPPTASVVQWNPVPDSNGAFISTFTMLATNTGVSEPFDVRFNLPGTTTLSFLWAMFSIQKISDLP